MISRGSFQNVYLNDDGTHTTEFSAFPLNVRTDAGIWVPVSTSIIRSSAGGIVVDHPLNPTFASKVDGDSLYSITDGVYSISFGLENSSGSDLAKSMVRRSSEGANRASYQSVFDSTDINFDVLPGQVKETLVLKRLPKETSWTWTISAPGLSLSKNEYGDIEFKDKAGDIRFTIPAPFMWDSSDLEGVRGPAESAVDTSLEQAGSGWRLTLRPDRRWLESSERVFPVFVDPTASYGAGSIRAWKSDGFNTPNVVYVGNSRDGNTNKYWRTTVHYGYEGLFGKQVTYAHWYGARHGGNGTANGYTGVINVANCLGYSCAGEQLSTYIVPISGWAEDMGLTYRFAQWVADGQSNKYLMIRGYEAGVYSWKWLDTALYIDWKDLPTAGTLVAPSPADGATAGTTPTLKISGSAAAGYTSYYQYKVSENPNPEVNTLYTSAWSTAAEFQIPVGVGLIPGHTYYWKGYVKDQYDGLYGSSTVRGSSTYSFKVDAPPPSPAQSSSSPEDGEVVVGLTPTFTTGTVVDPDGQPVQYQFRIATGSDGKTGALISSGWLDNPSWQVPAGTLQDGGSYSWVILTTDGVNDLESTWVNHFKVNLRIGDAGPSPTDSAGPVSVNLANGNMHLSFASPTVDTVGGPMGLAFSYNSLRAPDEFRGLTGQYFATELTPSSTVPFDFSGLTPVAVRTDPAISFNWNESQLPTPSIKARGFLVKWSGYLNVPASGDYLFGIRGSGGANVSIDGSSVLTTDNLPVDVLWQTAGHEVSFGSTPLSIQVQYGDTRSDSSPNATVELWVKDPQGNSYPVPSDWYTTKVLTLPSGWSRRRP